MENFCKFLHALALIAFVLALLIGSHPVAQAQVVRTGYSAIIAGNSSKCLDINGASSSTGASAIQWHCSGNANEAWTVTPAGGAFEIQEQQTGQCLSVSNASLATGAQLVQNTCTAAKGQLWTFTSSGSSFEIVNKSSGLCASVSGASVADTANVVQAACSTASNFLWTFASGLYISSTPAVLQADHSGQCMNVNGNSSTSGAGIIQWPCSGTSNEQWKFVPVSNQYQLLSIESNLCVTVNGSGTTATIIQAACSTSNADLWTLKPVAGAYQLVNEIGGLCLAVSGASQATATSLVETTCSSALNALWSVSAATLASSWTGVIPLAVDPIAVANLPNGQLLTWSAYDEYTYEGDIGTSSSGQTYTSIFDPVATTSTTTLVTNTGDDMFCPGTANLFDGRILVNGGSSSPKTSIFNPESGNWTTDALMNIPRGYEGDTVLSNGSVLTLGGSWSGANGGKTAELWTSGAGWTELTGVPETNLVGPDPAGIYRGDNHLWMFAAPNGQIFHAGPSAQMNWITTTGTGSIVSAGNRGNDPYAINGKAVLYDVGMIMKTGGAPAYQDANAEAATYLININTPTVNGPVTVTQIAPMAYPRAFANGVVLPNGQVVIIGGQTYPIPFTDTTSILIPEIWDPVTQVFRQLNPMQTPRNYHSSAILLPDGSVFEGGGGQCGSGCAENHFNTEILTPPYLLNANGSAATRPTISSAPTTVALGGTIAVTTGQPATSFVLMRLSSVTHTVNNDQRRIPLQIASTSGNSYTLSVPSNPGVVLEGYYWLFALNAQGVPSVASTILVN